MIHRLIPLAAVIGLSLASVRAEEREHPASVQIIFTVTEGETVVARAAVHTDLSTGEKEFDGMTTLVFENGKQWIVDINGDLGEESDDRRRLEVSVTDPSQMMKWEREGTSYVQAVTIINASRVWRGPGRYLIGERGNAVLAMEVLPTPEVGGKEAEKK